jgi:hypothetical protein
LSSTLAIRFLEGVKKLFVLLSALSKYEGSVDSSVYEDERSEAMLMLMEYLKETERHEMRINYINKLTSLHKSLGSHAEAGNVVLMTLGTSSGDILADITAAIETTDGSCPPLSSFDIQLLTSAMESFKLGNDWKKAMLLLDRLRKHYKDVTYEYNKLASVLEEQAVLYRHVHGQHNFYCSLFRVSFMGLGWDVSNCNKVFIYRGGPLESIMAFVARIKRKDAAVVVVQPGKETEDMKTKDNACYLQISSVKPCSLEMWQSGSNDDVKNTKNTVVGRAPPKHVTEYHLNFTTNTFTFSRPYRIKIWKGQKKEKSKNEFMDLWTKNIMLKTKLTLPSTTRRTEVIERREVIDNPLQVAVQAVRNKNIDLKERIGVANKLTERNAPQSFTMAINGTVDGKKVLVGWWGGGWCGALNLCCSLTLLFLFDVVFSFQHSRCEWRHCQFCALS